MEEQRKAFEAFLCPYDDDAMKRMTLEKRGDGNYAQALPRLQWKVWQAATAAERERCAAIADNHDGWDGNPANCIAEAIRDLGGETTDEAASRAAAAMMAGKPYVCLHPRATYGDPWVCLDCGFEGPSPFRNKD